MQKRFVATLMEGVEDSDDKVASEDEKVSEREINPKTIDTESEDEEVGTQSDTGYVPNDEKDGQKPRRSKAHIRSVHAALIRYRDNLWQKCYNGGYIMPENLLRKSVLTMLALQKEVSSAELDECWEFARFHGTEVLKMLKELDAKLAPPHSLPNLRSGHKEMVDGNTELADHSRQAPQSCMLLSPHKNGSNSIPHSITPYHPAPSFLARLDGKLVPLDADVFLSPSTPTPCTRSSLAQPTIGGRTPQKPAR